MSYSRPAAYNSTIPNQSDISKPCFVSTVERDSFSSRLWQRLVVSSSSIFLCFCSLLRLSTLFSALCFFFTVAAVHDCSFLSSVAITVRYSTAHTIDNGDELLDMELVVLHFWKRLRFGRSHPFFRVSRHLESALCSSCVIALRSTLLHRVLNCVTIFPVQSVPNLYNSSKTKIVIFFFETDS